MLAPALLTERTPGYADLLRVFALACWVVAMPSPPDRAASDDTVVDPYVVTLDTRPWIEALRSDDLFRTEPAIAALASLGDLALPPLTAALASEGRRARGHIVEVLRDIGSPATVPLLLQAAGDADAAVRADAIEALGRTADARAQPAVEAALDDQAVEVVRAAAAACRTLCRSPAAMRRLVHLALAPATASAARNSLLAMAESDRGGTVATVIREVAGPPLRAAEPPSRCHAALLLAGVATPEALPALRDCALAPLHPFVTIECVRALAAGGAAATALLADVARQGDIPARRTACDVLAAADDAAAAAVHAADCAQEQASPAAGRTMPVARTQP